LPLNSHVAFLTAVLAGDVRGDVGHDLAEPGRELLLHRAAELAKVAVGREACLLHEVRVIELGGKFPIGLKASQQHEIGSIVFEQLAKGLFIAGTGAVEKLPGICLARFFRHRGSLIDIKEPF
jgi:hypothetical protein